MPFDYVFPLPPALMSPLPSAPGSSIAPAQGIDTSTGVGYYNSGNGWVPQVPGTVNNLNLKAQSANVANTNLYAIPAHLGGLYQISAYTKLTTLGGSNSTMPSLTIYFTDAADNTVQNLVPLATNANNTTSTTIQQNTITIYASGGTNIIYNANGYLSNGTAMKYELQVRCTYLG